MRKYSGGVGPWVEHSSPAEVAVEGQGGVARLTCYGLGGSEIVPIHGGVIAFVVGVRLHRHRGLKIESKDISQMQKIKNAYLSHGSTIWSM